MARARTPLSPRGSLFLGVMTEDEARRAAENVRARGHHLKHPFTFDIDK